MISNHANKRHTISLTVNGEAITIEVAPWVSLVDTLRHHLDLTGTKKGCDHGQCGACTIIQDGKSVLSCLQLTMMADGTAITTIEGIANANELHPLQQAFIDHDAFQCGYCTPGQICSGIALLESERASTREEVKETMSGNLCRCGANTNIIDAIMAVKDGTHE